MNRLLEKNLLIILLLMTTTYIVCSWIYTGGYPFLYQNDESFLSYVHAWYMNFTNPFEFRFLTRQEPNEVYTHNPNLPRYFHFLLMKAGVMKFTWQLLIITLSSSLLTIYMMYRFLKSKIADISIVALSLLFLLITPQFVVFSVNSYRVFSFVLFALVFYAMAKGSRPLIFLAAFLLFQLEYAFAIFVFSAAVSFICVNWREHRKTLPYLMAGAFCSVLLFAMQISSYYSLQFITHELFNVVLPTRGAAHRNPIDILRVFPDIMNRRDQYYWYAYLGCLVIGAVTFYLDRHRDTDKFRSGLYVSPSLNFAFKFLLSLFVGGLITTVMLPGYCSDAYGDYSFPFSSLHKFAIFMFFLSFVSCLITKLTKLQNKQFGYMYLLSLVAVMPLLFELKLNFNYVDVNNINRGSYLKAFHDFKDKHYISNFWSGYVKGQNEPLPLYAEMAYGTEAIDKAAITYKSRHALMANDSIYYICVKQPSFYCYDMLNYLVGKWHAELHKDTRDYLIIEFPPKVLSRMTKNELPITEEQWVELGLYFLDPSQINVTLRHLQISKQNLTMEIGSITEATPLPLNLLHAFRKAIPIIESNPGNLYKIKQETIEYMQMRHPITWKAALLIALAKHYANASERELCNAEDIVKAYNELQLAMVKLNVSW